MTRDQDTVFDGAPGDALAREVYGTTKGDVRLHVLWEDLLAEVPRLREGGLRVIDAGAGMGQIARRLAELGHDVTVCDPSQEMLEKARVAMPEARSVRFVQATVQELGARVEGTFDLVLCHAVLEWLAQPKEAVGALVPLLAPEGYLSLMFYNRNAALLKRVLRGEFAEALSAAPGESPVALDPGEVRSWLIDAGLRVQSKAGIRIFHDHLPEELRTGERLQELLGVEAAYRTREPFASLGQHVHYVCRRV